MRYGVIFGLLAASALVPARATDDRAATTIPRAASGPNVIVFMADDLDTRSLDDLLAAGLMPNLAARIIERGVTFTRSYVSMPYCCPSRATYFKGQYPHNTGIVNNKLLMPDGKLQWALAGFDDSVTLATRLRALGYTTAHVGKYLNGYGSDAALAQQYPAFDPRYVPPGWSHWRALIDFTTYCVYNYRINIDGVPTTYLRPPGQTEDSETYQTHVLADMAEAFVLEHVGDAAPFYLEVMPLAPHAENCDDAYGGQPPDADSFESRIRPAPEDGDVPVPVFSPAPSYNEDLADKPNWAAGISPLTPEDDANLAEQYRQRLRSMLAVDRLIGRVTAALGARIDETTLIFTSDNGWYNGEHRLGGKGYPYLESTRVPLYIALPGGSARATRGNLVLNNDLAPTILDIVRRGYPEKPFDGRSLVPLLLDPAPPGWVDRSQVLIEYSRSEAHPGHDTRPTFSALRGENWMYVESYDGLYYLPEPPELIGLELYDIVRDPAEMNSLMHFPEDARLPKLGALLDSLKGCSRNACRQLENRMIR